MLRERERLTQRKHFIQPQLSNSDHCRIPLTICSYEKKKYCNFHVQRTCKEIGIEGKHEKKNMADESNFYLLVTGCTGSCAKLRIATNIRAPS